MRKRIGWVAVVGVLLALSGSGALPEKAVCADCRPAPDYWACLGVFKLSSGAKNWFLAV